MQCPRCHFENMPGLASCARCRTVLVVSRGLIVHPPRAGLGKLMRPLIYSWRRLKFAFTFETPASSMLARLFGEGSPWINICAFILSFIPPLGYCAAGRGRRGIPFSLAWIAALAAGLFAFGTQVGNMFIGVAIALHAWIMIDAGQVRDTLWTMLLRFAMIVALCLALAFGPYNALRLHAFPTLSIIYSPANYPAASIRTGDALIERSDAYARDAPRRGDIAIVERRERHNGGDGHEGGTRITVQQGTALGEIEGLPGDRVVLHAGSATVTSPSGEQQIYAVADYFGDLDTAFTVPPNQYFCVGSWSKHVQNGGKAMMLDLLQLTGFSDRDEIKSRAIALYEPPTRRHWLNARPDESFGGFALSLARRLIGREPQALAH